jgi:hypothetical protein
VQPLPRIEMPHPEIVSVSGRFVAPVNSRFTGAVIVESLKPRTGSSAMTDAAFSLLSAAGRPFARTWSALCWPHRRIRRFYRENFDAHLFEQYCKLEIASSLLSQRGEGTGAALVSLVCILLTTLITRELVLRVAERSA